MSRAERLCAAATLDRATTALHKAKTKAALAARTLANFDRELCDSSTCPTCHSNLSDSTKNSVRDVLEAELERSENTRRKASLVVEAYTTVEEHATYTEESKAYVAYTEVRRQLAVHPFSAVARHIAIQERLAVDDGHTSKLIKPEGIRADIEEELVAAETYVRLEHVIDTTRVPQPDEKLDRKALAALNAEVGEKMALLPMLQAQATERKTALRSITSLRERVADIGARIEDLPVYQLLADAYSVKGLKALMVKRVATSIEKSLNKYSRQVFSEDVRFSLAVDEGKFDVNVTRTSGKTAKTSDIRHMSGAESRLFVLLFVLAVLPLIPSARRMNLLVLDEPDTNLDPEALEVFATRLLPALQKIVPSVIVLTPRNDYMTAGARVVTVVKENGKSRLVEGVFK